MGLVGLPDPAHRQDGKKGEEQEASAVATSIRGTPAYASCTEDESMPFTRNVLALSGADPIDAHARLAGSSTVLPVTVQVLIAEDGSGSRVVAGVICDACTLHADAAFSRTVAVFSTRHGLTRGVEYTPFTGEEVFPCTAVTSGNDGLTDGCFSALVVTTTPLLPGSPCSRAFLDGLQCIGVCLALTTFSTDVAKTALTINLAFQGPCVLALAVDAECEAVSTIRILGALGFAVTRVIFNTPRWTHEGVPWSTITARFDGFTHGLYSTCVVPTAHCVPFSTGFDAQIHI